MGEFGLLWQFLSSVFSNWVLWAGGGIMTLIGVIERVSRKEIHWRIYARVMLGFLLVAFYLSWRDMRVALDEKPDDQPSIHLDVKDEAGRKELEQTKAELTVANQEIQKLRARVEDRHISAENKSALLNALKASPYKGTVLVKSDFTDGEAQQFAKEIEKILHEAGFPIIHAYNEVINLNGKGEFMFLVDVTKPPAHAKPIQDAFVKAGFLITGYNADENMQSLRDLDIKTPRKLSPDEIIIWVTRKP